MDAWTTATSASDQLGRSAKRHACRHAHTDSYHESLLFPCFGVGLVSLTLERIGDLSTAVTDKHEPRNLRIQILGDEDVSAISALGHSLRNSLFGTLLLAAMPS